MLSIFSNKNRKDPLCIEYIEDLSYKLGTIDCWEADRGIELYEKLLNFNIHDLDGKTILNLGCGSTLRFEREVIESGINVEIYSISPDFYEKERLILAQNLCPRARVFAGLGQKMPFFANVFDYVLAVAVLDHISKNVLLGLLIDVARVLKPAGISKIGPFHGSPDNCLFSNILKNQWLLDKLSEKNVLISLESLGELSYEVGQCAWYAKCATYIKLEKAE